MHAAVAARTRRAAMGFAFGFWIVLSLACSPPGVFVTLPALVLSVVGCGLCCCCCVRWRKYKAYGRKIGKKEVLELELQHYLPLSGEDAAAVGADPRAGGGGGGAHSGGAADGQTEDM